MIFQIDHLGLSCLDFGAGRKTLEGLGFSMKFREDGKRNPGVKRDMMRDFPERHGLAYFTKAGSISVELLDHGREFPNRQFIVPVFDDGDSSSHGDIGGGEFFSKELNADIFSKRPGIGDRSRITGFIVKAFSFDESARFWQALGFKRNLDASLGAEFSFSSPVCREPFSMYLRRSDAESRHFLDDAGFNCVALTSSSADKERESLSGNGFATTGMEELDVNGRRLRIFFARGPSGELVEIIGI